MADEQQEQQQEQTPSEGKTYTEAEVRALLEQETGGLKSKLEELLGESKTAKQKARELEEQQRQNEEARLAEKQEFKTLYEREQEAKRALQEEHETFKQRVQRVEIEKASESLASELASRDASRRELLAEKVAHFARYTDDGIKYEMGGVEVDASKVTDHLREKYPFLVDGNGSSGGGATGNKGGGAAKKWGDFSEPERAAMAKDNPEEFKRLLATRG